MFVNISNVMVDCYPIRMRGTIQMKMIGWKLVENNNIICIFSRKLNYFSSTSTIIQRVKEAHTNPMRKYLFQDIYF